MRDAICPGRVPLIATPLVFKVTSLLICPMEVGMVPLSPGMEFKSRSASWDAPTSGKVPLSAFLPAQKVVRTVDSNRS